MKAKTLAAIITLSLTASPANKHTVVRESDLSGILYPAKNRLVAPIPRTRVCTAEAYQLPSKYDVDSSPSYLVQYDKLQYNLV